MTIDGFDELLDGIEQIKRAILSLVTAEDTNSGVTKVEIVRDIPRMVPQPVTHVNIKAVSKDDGVTPVNLVADPATGHLQVDSTGGGGGGGGGVTNKGLTVYWSQPNLSGNSAATFFSEANRRWWVELPITLPSTITGIAFYTINSDDATKAIVELHDTDGVLLANSDLAGTVIPSVGAYHQVPFTTPLTTTSGGRYFASFIFNDVNIIVSVLAADTTPANDNPFVSGAVDATFGTNANFTPGTTCTPAYAVYCSTY